MKKIIANTYKLSESGRSKSGIADRRRDLINFKRRFSMIVEIMLRAHSGHPGVTSGTFEQRGITRGGDF